MVSELENLNQQICQMKDYKWADMRRMMLIEDMKMKARDNDNIVFKSKNEQQITKSDSRVFDNA